MVACLDDLPPAPVSPYEAPALVFVHSLVNQNTGLVASRTGECFTTVYKNALAAMVFIHEGNHAAANAIFDHFDSYRMSLSQPFKGFPQDWDACTGLPMNANNWEGDNAFLLMALSYQFRSTNQPDKYKDLRSELVSWLLQRSNLCETIIAEGTANMYAALLPYATNPAVKDARTRLKDCFDNTVSYAAVLDHTVRGALVFDDFAGFEFLPNFKRTENWIVTDEPIAAYSAFSADNFINVEISAQLLLTSKLKDRMNEVPGLQQELEKLWLYQNFGKESGLPYFITNIGFDDSATQPIIDPTIYLLFTYWNFDPFKSGTP